MRASVLLCVSAVACTGDDEVVDTALDSGSGVECAATSAAIVTDIDETLTTDDLEWVKQILDPDHDPEARPDADTLMNGWADRGYTVVYVTARGEDAALVDGTSARDATVAWLAAHDFPYTDANVYLADGIGAFGEDAVDYKAGVLDGLTAAGTDVVWAYGNAETDIEAFQAGGVPDDHIFLVGDLAGTMGVEPITNEDAYTNHVADFLVDQGCAE